MNKPAHVVTFSYGSASVNLILWKNQNHATVSGLHSKQRGIGHATKLMQQVIDFADEYGKRLILTACATEPESGLSQTQLVRFYEKFGFVVVNEAATSFQVMERNPK